MRLCFPSLSLSLSLLLPSIAVDMVAVVDHVVRLLERAGNRLPLFAVGVSAGANAIALHCAHTGAKCKLDAFVGISNPFDIDQTCVCCSSTSSSENSLTFECVDYA